MRFTIKLKDTNMIIAQGKTEETAQSFEGHWYFSPEVVDQQYLIQTERTYTCPYKGVCYWLDLQTPDLHARNVAWVYPQPLPGYEFIQDKIAFYARDTLGTTALQVDETASDKLALPEEDSNPNP